LHSRRAASGWFFGPPAPPSRPLPAPLSPGFLFFKGVNAANEAAEMQDRIDGYIK
jgi:hypothetical protein